MAVGSSPGLLPGTFSWRQHYLFKIGDVAWETANSPVNSYEIQTTNP